MAKAKSDKQGEQKTGETVVEAQTVIANDVQFEAAVFPESSVDSAFAAREAEAPLVGQPAANVEPQREDSDARNVTLASVEKVAGSEVHGTESPAPIKEQIVGRVRALLVSRAIGEQDVEGRLDVFDEVMRDVIRGEELPRDQFNDVGDAAAREFGLRFEFKMAQPSEDGSAKPAPTKAEWKETHRVVTGDSVYPVMVVDLGTKDHERAFAWTHAEYAAATGIAPALNRQDGSWWLNGEPFTGNVHALAPAAEDRHTHRRA